MDLLDKYFWVVVVLLLGAFSVITAVAIFVEHMSIPGAIVWLLLGAALTSVGLVNLMGWITPEWATVSTVAVFGLWTIWTSIVALHAPPEPRYPRWTQWAALVFGVGAMLFAVLRVWAIVH